MSVDVRTIKNRSCVSFWWEFGIEVKSSISHSVAGINSIKCSLLVKHSKTGWVCWSFDRLQSSWLQNSLTQLIWLFCSKVVFPVACMDVIFGGAFVLLIASKNYWSFAINEINWWKHFPLMIKKVTVFIFTIPNVVFSDANGLFM